MSDHQLCRHCCERPARNAPHGLCKRCYYKLVWYPANAESERAKARARKAARDEATRERHRAAERQRRAQLRSTEAGREADNARRNAYPRKRDPKDTYFQPPQ